MFVVQTGGQRIFSFSMINFSRNEHIVHLRYAKRKSDLIRKLSDLKLTPQTEEYIGYGMAFLFRGHFFRIQSAVEHQSDWKA